jgi:hypothetical protein
MDAKTAPSGARDQRALRCVYRKMRQEPAR